MPKTKKTEAALKVCITTAGGPKQLADLLGVSRQAIHKWINKGYVPIERLHEIEEKLGKKFTPKFLRPDIFNGDMPAIEKAILKFNGADKFAEAISVTPGVVSHWLNNRRKVAPHLVRRIVEVMKEGDVETITPHELRPDIFKKGYSFSNGTSIT